MFYKENKIGTSVIEDLSIVPGPNPVTVLATLDDPENNVNAKELFKFFLTGQAATISIKGNDKSTNITSLIPAFKAINIPSTLPPFNKPLVLNAKIVTDNQTASTNYSTGIAEISNSFVTPISIYTMNSSFSFNGTVLGTLEQDNRNNPIFIPGNTVQTLQFPVKMVIDPAVTFSMLRTLALQNNLDVTVLDTLIALSNVTVPGADLNAKPTPDIINSFDLGKFITTALAKIPLTISMDDQIAIGDYFMSITYKQDIIATTDQSILNMIPALATPLINHMVDQTQMTFDSVLIQNIDVASFDTLASGQITNVGPLPAVITFPDGVDVYSDNIRLGKALIPPIATDPNGGAKFNNVSKFIIDDVTTFASFSAYSYTAAEVSWEISSNNVMITSFGLPIGPISIKKTIQIDGFNGLKNFHMGKYTFPLTFDVDIDNPSSVGIELGKVVYDLFIDNENIATITGDNIVINPKGTSELVFQGGNLNLSNPNLVSSLFTSNQTIIAQGVSITPPKATGEVLWLSETFKSVKLTVPLDPASFIKSPTPPPVDPAAPAAPAALVAPAA
jgi:LEA14-like dessication related protein